jgi:hypothetical protein
MYDIVILIAGIIILLNNMILAYKYIRDGKLKMRWLDWMMIVVLIPAIMNIARFLS